MHCRIISSLSSCLRHQKNRSWYLKWEILGIICLMKYAVLLIAPGEPHWNNSQLWFPMWIVSHILGKVDLFRGPHSYFQTLNAYLCLFFTCAFLMPKLVVWVEKLKSGFDPVKLIFKSLDVNRQAVGTLLTCNDFTRLWTRTDLSGKTITES